VEAAHIAWRPLGRLLVEQGLLTAAELELALTAQQETGLRLGETIVKCGFVSGPQLANALAAQYGIELMTEKGFGTGLRSEIQRRHETDRRRVIHLAPPPPEDDAPPSEDEAAPIDPAPEPPAAEAALLAQLEEQWAKLAAAEESLSERERELLDLRGSNEQREQEIRQLEELNGRLKARIEELRVLPEIESDEGLDERFEPALPTTHLVFAQLDGRYELITREGPPPEPSTAFELPDVDDGLFVVAGSRRSPLPGDARPCVFVQRVVG
jgi:hypothetical protein